LKAFFPHVGGKQQLKNKIYAHFPINYKNLNYIEVFGGAGSLLFKKAKSNFEIFNDIDKNITNLFKSVQLDYQEVEKIAYELKINKEFFEIYKKEYTFIKSEDEIDFRCAALFLYLKKFSYGSKMKDFTTCQKSKKILATGGLKQHAERIKNVNILNLDFKKIITKYDNLDSFFYIDPPYLGGEKMYKNEKCFNEKNHMELSALLKNIKGKFVLSYNDTEAINHLYTNFDIIKVERSNSLATGTIYKELIIKNF
jgi:DNA adenine methylase